MKRFISFLLLVFVLAFFGQAWAAQYYVYGTGGNDSNNGSAMTTGAGWLTIQKALNTVAAGDTVYIKAGTYSENLTLKTTGTYAERITLINYQSGTVTINATSPVLTCQASTWIRYYTISGLRFTTSSSGSGQEDASVNLQGSNNWFSQGATGDAADGHIIQNCYIEGGLRVYGKNIQILNNEIHGKSKAWVTGIRGLHRVTNNVTVTGNTIYNYSGRGIWFMHWCDNITVNRNTIYNCTDMGIDPDGADHMLSGWSISDNIIHDITGASSGQGINCENLFNSTITRNVIYACVRAIDMINYGTSGGYVSDAEYRNTDSNVTISYNIIRDNPSPTYGYGGINVYTVKGVRVYGNVFYNNTGSGCAAINLHDLYGFTCTGWAIRNNAFSGNTQAILSANMGTHTITNNSFYSTGTAYGSSTITADPKFTNAAGGDFTLAVDSPLIGAGANLGTLYGDGLDPDSSWPSSVSTLNQDSYSSWEIGAYIYLAEAPAGIDYAVSIADATADEEAGVITFTVTSTPSVSADDELTFTINTTVPGAFITDNFDDGDISDWSVWNTPTASTDQHNSGTHSVKFDAAENMKKAFTANSDIYTTFYVYTADALPAASQNLLVPRINAGVDWVGALYIATDGYVWYWNEIGQNAVDGTVCGTMPESGWVKFTQRLKTGNPNGVLQVWMNDVLCIDSSTQNLGEIAFDMWEYGSNRSPDSAIYIDDVSVYAIIGERYVPITGSTGTINSGQSTTTIDVTIIDNDVVDSDFNFTVTLSAIGCSGTSCGTPTFSDATATGTISDALDGGTQDSTPPTFTVNSDTDVGPTKTDIINVTVNDSSTIILSQYGFSADATCDASDTYGNTFTSAVNFSITGNHVDYLCVKAMDYYNNTAYETVGQLNVDNTAPVVAITNPTSGEVGGTDTITFSSSGGADPELSIDNSNWVNATSGVTDFSDITGFDALGAGAYFTLYLRDTDWVGGNTGSHSVSLRVEGGSAGDIAACGTIATSGGSHLVSGNLTNAGGTCLIISGSNNIVDLGGYKITAGTSAAGVGVTITGNNNKVFNGSIAVGGGTQVNVAGVYLAGTGNEIYYLDIETSGGAISGEQYVNSVHIANAPNKVHHIWGKVSGTTTNISYAPDNIWYTARNSGGAEIHDCVLVGGHRAINADLVGYNVVEAGGTPQTSRIYNNYVQHLRTPGCKQPNGIGVTMASRFEVYNNQIISDDGRGFITSCYGNGNPTGTSYVNFYNNRVDVGYMIPAAGGQYPENHVAGTYSRYSTFNSTVNDNIIIVNNAAGDATECSFNGSDSPDLQGNNTYSGNVFINHDTGTDAAAFRLAVYSSLYMTNNTYLAPAGLWIGNWDYYNSGGVPPTVSGNTVITPTSYTPSAPTGLALRKFSTDCYLLTWNDNRTTYPAETQTYEYFIYKDDVKVSGITSRGGTFYVDLDEGDATDYKITAVNLYGTEGAACANVNTSTATAGWTGSAADTTPPIISGGSPTTQQICNVDPQTVTFSVVTNENATCKYSATDIAYASMANTFATTGGLNHSQSSSFACGSGYIYYVRCSDSSSNVNTSSAIISISIGSLDIDATAPTCTITTPADDPHASVAATVTIEGTASDAVGVTSVTWVNDQGGSGTATGTTSWSFTAALTTSGNNTFTVSANDAAGNAGTDTVVVTYDVPPTIVIASPASGTYTASDFTITISGVCDDDSAVTAVSWANDLGGSDTCTTDGATFSCVVQLFRGVNTVTITAADDDEPANESTDELVVTYLTSIFYINDGTGDDAYSGTSPDNPWETVDQLSASTFSPGDQVLLRRGRTFTGKIVMPSSGSAGSPIILGAYGTGEDPVLDCSGETNCIDADSQTYVTIGNIHMINSTGARITGHDATWTIAANSYYMDATSGSNSNVGSESLPYETVAYVACLVWMIPGDIVYLKKGETFTGPLIIPASGDSDNYIYVKAYGSGNRPVIQ